MWPTIGAHCTKRTSKSSAGTPTQRTRKYQQASHPSGGVRGGGSVARSSAPHTCLSARKFPPIMRIYEPQSTAKLKPNGGEKKRDGTYQFKHSAPRRPQCPWPHFHQHTSTITMCIVNIDTFTAYPASKTTAAL